MTDNDYTVIMTVVWQVKHLFLKHAKVLRQADFKVDGDFIPLQQQERKSFGDEFTVLKAKGHNDCNYNCVPYRKGNPFLGRQS